MKKLIRVVAFAVLMAGAVTASFSSSSSTKVSLTSGGDPIPLCDPSAPKCQMTNR